jgi:hypothetical protein
MRSTAHPQSADWQRRISRGEARLLGYSSTDIPLILTSESMRAREVKQTNYFLWSLVSAQEEEYEATADLPANMGLL